jgi:hypothetical protein
MFVFWYFVKVNTIAIQRDEKAKETPPVYQSYRIYNEMHTAAALATRSQIWLRRNNTPKIGEGQSFSFEIAASLFPWHSRPVGLAMRIQVQPKPTQRIQITSRFGQFRGRAIATWPRLDVGATHPLPLVNSSTRLGARDCH